jgi:DNA-binding HxlR family transcriptional regulator
MDRLRWTQNQTEYFLIRMKMNINADPINCSIALALNQVGEKWSLLIVREAIMGTTRFDEFQQHLGIARNILNDRLTTLIEIGVLNRTQSNENARIYNYCLTVKGQELLSVLAALMHWGDRWIHAAIGPPIVLLDKKTRKPIREMLLTAQDGRLLKSKDIDITAGPGATPRMRTRLL